MRREQHVALQPLGECEAVALVLLDHVGMHLDDALGECIGLVVDEVVVEVAHRADHQHAQHQGGGEPGACHQQQHAGAQRVHRLTADG